MRCLMWGASSPAGIRTRRSDDLIFLQQAAEVGLLHPVDDFAEREPLDPSHLEVAQRASIPQLHGCVQQVADVVGAAPEQK